MLSWAKWNERIIWLRDAMLTPFGTIWARAQQWPVVSIVGIGAALFVVYFYKTPIQNILNHAEDGKIVVNSPTVYTRQRLVNDRLDQARWLRTQLEFTEKEREKDFKSIDQINSVYSSMQVNLGEGSGGDKKSEKPVPSSISVEATTTAQFRAKNIYREEVRSEITQTELDDRHDIRGNTIFRLAFDASILAGTRKGSVAGIGIKLSHLPESAKDTSKIVYDDDYQGLYEDWGRYFQDTIRKSLSIVPQSIMSPDPIPQLRILFTEFLLRRICQFMRNDPELTNDPVACEIDERKNAETLLAEYSEARFKTLQGFRLNGFVGAVEGYAHAGYALPLGNVVQPAASKSINSAGSNANAANSQFPSPAASAPADDAARLQQATRDLAPLISAATRACAEQQKAEIALWELKITSPAAKPISAPPAQSAEQPASSATVTGPGPQTENSNAPGAGRPTEQNRVKQHNTPHSTPSDDRIACPFYDTLSERLVSGILLYENLLSLATATERKQIVALDPEARRAHVLAELKSCERGACQVSAARLRCFSADFVKSNLNSFHAKNVEDQQKIKHYLNLQIVGRDVNDCNILVATHEREKVDTAGIKYSPLTRFVEKLNRGTDAFAYSVTPKNLTENISTAAETRDAFELMFRAVGDNKQIANLLQQRSEHNQAIVAHPIVVGFGTPSGVRQISGGSRTTSGIRDIDFGWIIAPRSRVTGDFEQIDGQYSLTAFISVPAWWRTVEVDIGVCWLSRAALAKIRAAPDICSGTQHSMTKAVTVRLPSAIPEISRKLGFDVVQQPSLYEPRQKELIVGAPGALLLEGARLWRSTEVTAGSQRAEKISVLPNMEGILAEFKCVLPPAGQRQTRQNKQVDDDKTQVVTMDWVRVWTSEGVTEPVPLVFVWPKEWETLLSKCQNPSPSQTAAQATSQAAAENAKHPSSPKSGQPAGGTDKRAEATAGNPLASPSLPAAPSVTPPAMPAQ